MVTDRKEAVSHNHSTAVPTPAATGAVTASGGVERVEVSVGGMTCPHCPPLVEKALLRVDGVDSAHVNLATGIASVDFDPGRTGLKEIIAAIRRAGYSAATATAWIGIKNMGCGSCVSEIERAMRSTPDVVAT